MYLNVTDFYDLVTLLLKTGQKKLPIITDEQRDIILVVSFVLSSAICLFGMVANAINTVVFYKQGFKNTVNISFLGLALSDFGCVLCLQWLCICVNPFLNNSDVPFYGYEIEYVTAAIPHVVFSRITSFITAFVTVERCLGVIFPLKVKRIITPRVTIIVLIAIFIVNILSVVPEFFVVKLAWKFFEHKNRTLLGTVFIEGHPMEGVGYFLSPLLGTATLVVVVVFTAILVVQLKQKSQWRLSVTNSKTETLSKRDKNSMRIVVIIASVLIVCNIPGVILFIVMIFEPEFRLNGDYARLFLGAWSFPLMFHAINSSVNIFFYYKMSTNYRQLFQQFVRRCGSGKCGGITTDYSGRRKP